MQDTFGIVQKTLFFALLGSITALFVWMLRDLILPLFWAVVFAVLLFPVFTRLRKQLHGKGILAAILIIIFTLVVILVPMYIIGTMIVNEAISVYLSLSGKEIDAGAVVTQLPVVSSLVHTFIGDPQTVSLYVTDAIKNASGWLASQALEIGANTLNFALKFALMIYVLFFLLKDGERLGKYLFHILPLGDEKEHLLFTRFASTTRAIIKGTVVVSIVQGAIGALLFMIAGVPSPALWGVAMGLFALIPAIGPSIIWLPAGLVLFFTGNLFGAIIVLAGGGVVVSLIDNILRPILVGRDTEMSDAIILLAILGGLASFGLAGIIIGPVIAALFISIWNLFVREYETELGERG